jgi:hypothetical protein
MRAPTILPTALSGVLVAVLVALGAAAPEQRDAVFADVPAPATPFAPGDVVLSSSWYCPGVPVREEGGFGGEIVVTNLADVAATGALTVLVPEGDPVVDDFEVAPRSQLVVDVSESATATFAGVVVELYEGSGVVEQRAIHPAGTSVAPCANSTSDTWYFADGTTAQGSVEQIVLMNPFPGPAVIDLTFVTESGRRTPRAFQGFVLAPQSVSVITLGDTLAQNERRIAISLVAASGRFVAGRSQHYLGGGRLGYSMVLGAPSTDDQWWFADGEIGDGISESIVVYNPSGSEVAADVVVLGAPASDDVPFLEPITLTIPAGEVSVLDLGGLGVVPEGRHGIVVSTLAEAAVVVERVITRPAGDFVVTSVVLGARPGYLSNRWHLPTVPGIQLADAIVVLNVTGLEGKVSVSALGPSGTSPLVGLEDVTIPASGVVTVDLPADVAGRHLVVEADVQLVVERLLPRRDDLRGRSGSLGVPG